MYSGTLRLSSDCKIIQNQCWWFMGAKLFSVLLRFISTSLSFFIYSRHCKEPFAVLVSSLLTRWICIVGSHVKHGCVLTFSFSAYVQIKSFFGSLTEETGSEMRCIQQTYETIEDNIRWMDTNFPLLKAWLDKRNHRVAHDDL